MSTAVIAPPRGAPGIGGGVVGLLALMVFINYVDRGNLATAAPLIKDELKLSAAQIGVLLSAFFWSYTPAQLLAGWLAERINAYRTLALGLTLWSLATAASGLAANFATLIALRLLLGLGESAAFPCSSKLIGQHLPAHKLGGANGLIALGPSLGPAFGTFAGGLLMASAGWRPAFLIFGLLSLLWLWPWLMATRHASASAKEERSAPAPSYRAILKHRQAWGACLGHFSANYAFYFVISWLPLYLVKERGFTVAHMGELGGLIYLAYAASSWLSGRLSDHLIGAGADASRVRKSLAVAGHAVVAASLIGCALGDAPVSIAFLMIAAAGFGLNAGGIFAIGQTLAGPRASGKWIGLQNCVGNVAGIVGPIVTGVVIDRTGSFLVGFLIAGAMSLLGILGWGVLIRRIEPIGWVAA